MWSVYQLPGGGQKKAVKEAREGDKPEESKEEQPKGPKGKGKAASKPKAKDKGVAKAKAVIKKHAAEPTGGVRYSIEKRDNPPRKKKRT